MHTLDYQKMRVVFALALAIAQAEGYFRKGSRPDLDNNPGDLNVDVLGLMEKHGPDKDLAFFSTSYKGWAELVAQCHRMVFRTSGVYSTSMTIQSIAMKYAPKDGEWQAWANNVAWDLKCSVNDTLNDLIERESRT